MPFSDVTSDNSMLVFDVYDRGVEDSSFLGFFEMRPVLVHEQTVDQWVKYVNQWHSNALDLINAFRLQARENEQVTGDVRVQVTYEQFKVRTI